MNKFTIPQPPDTFGNPFLLCRTCQERVTNVSHPGSRNVPCGHRGYEDVCPSWGPVDGCTCSGPHRAPAPVREVDCPLTELPPSQCACPKHRGGELPGHEEIEVMGPAFAAKYEGRCERCDRPIHVDDRIVRVVESPWYAHERCPR